MSRVFWSILQLFFIAIVAFTPASAAPPGTTSRADPHLAPRVAQSESEMSPVPARPANSSVPLSHIHPREPIAVLVLVPDLGFRELAQGRTPWIERLAAYGGAGMMNVRTVHAGSVDEGFLTVGAGARANVSFVGEIGQSFESSEHFEGSSAADVYRRRTALDPQRFRILALDYAQIVADSAIADYDLRPGLLGDTLRQAGIRPAAIGNGDEPAGFSGQNVVFHREVVGAAMDHLGRVAAGDVSEKLLKVDPASPFSVHVNETRILREVAALSPSCRYIAIEDGDLLSLHASSAVYTGAAYRRYQQAAVERLDRIVGGLMRGMDLSRDLLIVCSPAIEASPSGPITLTPIVAAGPTVRHDWVSSAATRRAGLVVITDLAPTILSFFGLAAPPSFSGSPISGEPATRRWGSGLLWNPGSGSTPLTTIGALATRITRSDQERDDVQRWFVYLIQALVLVSAAAIALPGWRPLAKSGLVQWGMLVTIALPLAMFLEPFFSPQSSGLAAVLVGGITAIVVWGARTASRFGWSPVAVIAWLTAIAISLDLLTGQQAMVFSMLSYSPSEGARYYGIGNEYMGVLLGAAVCSVCSAAGAASWKRALGAFAFFIPVALICMPSIGAKAGGALVAGPTAVLGAWLLLGGRMGRRTPLLLGAAGIGFLAALVVWDLHTGHSMSHIGRAAEGIQAGGTHELLNIIRRKSLMEWRLMKYSPWSRCLLFTLIALCIIYFARRPSWRNMMNDTRWRAAVWALGAASLTGLLFNDAGVLAAALSLIWLPALVTEKTAPAKHSVVPPVDGASGAVPDGI